MLHKFFEPGDWFSAKTHGYGAGLPIAWQGWALLASYLALGVGSGLLIERGSFGSIVAGITTLVVATVVFVLIAKRRTRGGWRWRNGERD